MPQKWYSDIQQLTAPLKCVICPIKITHAVKVWPYRAAASAAAAASPLKYIVTLGNQFSSITMYSNGDAAADARCGQTLT